MKIESLRILPQNKIAFKLSQVKYVPASAGGYVLATAYEDILYVGKSNNLRRRMEEHLNDPQKTNPKNTNSPRLFYWTETGDTEGLERAWVSNHQAITGELPPLNAIEPPIASL